MALEQFWRRNLNCLSSELWTSEVHAHFVFAWDGWFRFPCASESTKCVVLWDIWPWKRGGGWNGMVCILLGSMTRWFLFLARAGLRCMMAVATAAPAKRCLQVDAIPVFPVRALHGRIIGLLAVGFTGHACSPQTFLPVTNQKWRGTAPDCHGVSVIKFWAFLSCFYSDVSGKCWSFLVNQRWSHLYPFSFCFFRGSFADRKSVV